MHAAMGEPLDPDMLLKAYAIGVFPMSDDRTADDVYWVEPKKRGVLPLAGFRLSRSLAKKLKSDRFEHTANADFAGVVRACAEAAEDRPSTWINGQIEEAVHRLHKLGRAHSIETWAEGRLVGGLYGISLGRAFFGESMFSRETDASKLALAHLIARLRAGGFTLLDCQFITPHLASLGAIEISRAQYSNLLDQAISTDRPEGDFGRYFSSTDEDGPASLSRAMMVSSPISGWRILQSLTHTS
jgi:leucyl/phenylalanyl-tRNA--protein transferase